MNALWNIYKDPVFLMDQAVSNQIDFAIITACNPYGETISQSSNSLRDKQLQSDIKDLDVVYRRLIGASPCLTHQEKSWMVAIDKYSAEQLAEKYQQNAIYWVESDQLFLTPCLLNQECEEYIGRFSARSICVHQ